MNHTVTDSTGTYTVPCTRPQANCIFPHPVALPTTDSLPVIARRADVRRHIAAKTWQARVPVIVAQLRIARGTSL